MAEVYLLEWDYSEVEDDEFFVRLLEFPGHQDIVRLARTTYYELPERIFFAGNIQKLETLDFPYNNVSWPLMSSAMLGTLKSIKDFAHREIPVMILSEKFANLDSFPKDRELNSEFALERFAAIQLLDHIDSFDWENSVYVRSELVPNMVDYISKLVLKPVHTGLPPIFRLSAYPTLLFVSSEARVALEKAKIRGVLFTEIGDYPIASPKK